MSTGFTSPPVASGSDGAAAFCGTSVPGEMVEIGLLMPAEWAVGLMELSKKRHESVGQLLRSLIGRELVANKANV